MPEMMEATPLYGVIWTVPFPHHLHPVGEHQNFPLVTDVVYYVFNPYSETNTCDWIRIYVNKEIWYRMDGGIPDVNVGFKLDGGTTQVLLIPETDPATPIRIVAKKDDTILNAQWLGYT